MSSVSKVDVVVWPDADSAPRGDFNPGSGEPFGVLRLLGYVGGANIRFQSSVEPADQAKYLRKLAEAAARLADQLDPPVVTG